jgi:UDP-N-acetylglucosamine 2-epimerase (non-hydrolysing)
LKIAVVLGTRPEIIKMAPVIRALEKKSADFFIVHTGQHYSYHLDRVFFKELRLPAAKHNLEVGSGSHAEQTARVLVSVEKVLKQENPDIVLVEGDTNSVLAAALAAAKLHIKVGHVEAGLRSYDRNMPEEINRVLADHSADFLFAPTETAKNALLTEGIPEAKIFVTGNTIVDAVYQTLAIAERDAKATTNLTLKPKGYFLATIHRQENVDNQLRFTSILKGLDEVADSFGVPVVYPAHPRSRKMLARFGLQPAKLRLIEPVAFGGFLELEKSARLILTDSGGVQEEACILGTPCVTLRDNTERPETLAVGANTLAGVLPKKIIKSCHLMLAKKNSWQNPFGDGKAGERIANIITEVNDG